MDFNNGESESREFSPEELRQAIINFFGGEPRQFRPFAVYHEQLRMIWVMIRDCSYTQTMINGSFYILEDNYPENGEDRYVGFEIWTSSDFLRAEGLVLDNCVDLNKVLDLIAIRFRSTIPEVMVCRSMLEKLESSLIELSPASLV